ncbi:hypothetical protein BJ085DRAFT_19513, partial [Dimargaris cristalligena]
MFFNAVQQYPNHIATEFAGQTQTYTEIAHNIQGLASYLQQLPINPGDRVAVIVADHPHTILAMLAIWSVGATYVPVDSKLPYSRQKYIMETAQCSHIVNATKSTTEWPSAISLTDSAIGTHQPINYSSVYPIQPIDLAYIIFTSGTTGLPKGVMVQHNSLANNISNNSFKELWKPGQRVLSGVPSGFDAYFFAALSTIVNGAILVFYEDTFLSVLPVVECAVFTASTLSLIEPHHCPRLKAIVCGAE